MKKLKFEYELAPTYEEYKSRYSDPKDVVFLISYDISKKKDSFNEEKLPNPLFKENFEEFIEKLNKQGKYGKIGYRFYVESTIYIDLNIRENLALEFGTTLKAFFTVQQSEMRKQKRDIKYIFLYSEKINLYKDELI